MKFPSPDSSKHSGTKRIIKNDFRTLISESIKIPVEIHIKILAELIKIISD